jgi:outer membrane lipoprotein SlyB
LLHDQVPHARFGLRRVSLLTVSACVTDPNTGERKVSRTAIGGVGGAAAGALLGGLIGGKTGRIVGAGIGGVAGGVVGYQMDKQIKELKEQTAGIGRRRDRDRQRQRHPGQLARRRHL